MNYKDTLNLPQTGFPMKAGLVEREPKQLKQWYAEGIHEKLRARHTQAKETFVLHDGPPFANGDVHIGTALNKILKDIILKFLTMRGKNVPYVPGWDCHGLPIELQVDRSLGSRKREMSPIEFRRACREYAEKFVDIQRDEFERLGVLVWLHRGLHPFSERHREATVAQIFRHPPHEIPAASQDRQAQYEGCRLSGDRQQQVELRMFFPTAQPTAKDLAVAVDGQQVVFDYLAGQRVAIGDFWRQGERGARVVGCRDRNAAGRGQQ